MHQDLLAVDYLMVHARSDQLPDSTPEDYSAERKTRLGSSCICSSQKLTACMRVTLLCSATSYMAPGGLDTVSAAVGQEG